MGLKHFLFGSSDEHEEPFPSDEDILARPIGEGWPSSAEVRAGAPSLFADHSAKGGYSKALDDWEHHRENLAGIIADAEEDDDGAEESADEEPPAPEEKKHWWSLW